MTICKNCKHFHAEGSEWYEQYCRACPLVKNYNFQLGEGATNRYVYSKGHYDLVVKELDRKDLVADLYWSDQIYQFASRINTYGECKMFEEM